MRIEGLDDLEQRLESIADNVGRDKVVRSSLMAAATPILKAAIEKAPERSGNLKSFIKKRSRVHRGSGRVSVFIGVNRKGFFGMFVEFGTKTTTAQPFLRPAYDEKKEEALAVFKTSLANKIRRLERARGS